MPPHWRRCRLYNRPARFIGLLRRNHTIWCGKVACRDGVKLCGVAFGLCRICWCNIWLWNLQLAVLIPDRRALWASIEARSDGFSETLIPSLLVRHRFRTTIQLFCLLLGNSWIFLLHQKLQCHLEFLGDFLLLDLDIFAYFGRNSVAIGMILLVFPCRLCCFGSFSYIVHTKCQYRMIGSPGSPICSRPILRAPIKTNLNLCHI